VVLLLLRRRDDQDHARRVRGRRRGVEERQPRGSHSGSLDNQYGDQTATWGAYGRSANNDRGCWKLDGRTFLLSQDGVSYAAVPYEINRNSSGYPIIKSGQGELMMCN
jgi:hypothetical protein